MATEMLVEKTILINKSQTAVFNYLKYIQHQNEFSVWNMKDPTQKVSNKGTDGTVGFVYSWESKDKSVGAGSQEIKSIVANEKIEYELRFERPMKNIAQSRFVLTKVADNTTQVTWDFKGPTKFPMSLFKSIFQKMLGKDMAKSLENLKGKLEQ